MATTLSNWTIDPVHSSVEFSLDYMGFATYRTGFRALLLVLCISEPPASFERPKKWAQDLKEVLSATLVRHTATRPVLLNLVAGGTGGLVMFWVNQKYWQESGVPRAWFGVLSALGILFSIAFVCLLLPLVLRETAPSPADGLRA